MFVVLVLAVMLLHVGRVVVVLVLAVMLLLVLVRVLRVLRVLLVTNRDQHLTTSPSHTRALSNQAPRLRRRQMLIVPAARLRPQQRGF